jgi:flagellar motor switch protein FliN
MTLQASLVDLDILLAAGGAVADRLTTLGRLDPRVVAPSQLGLLASPSGLGARLAGAAPGQLYLFAGDEAAAALTDGAGADGGLEPALADVVATLKMQVGDVRPEDVRELGSGDAPVLDETTVAVGIFADDRIVAAIVFTASPVAAVAGAAGAAGAAGVAGAAAAAGANGSGSGRVGALSAAAPVFAPLASAEPARVDARRMNLLRDVTMDVSVELGRTRMTVRELLALTPGMIVELDKAAGAPVDLLVNGTLMARGEVVVIDEEFAVRISEIVSPDQDNRLGA